MRSILLIGGTGAIGEHLQRVCLDLGFRVCVTSRRCRANTLPGVEIFRGNAKEGNFILKLLEAEQFDAIVDFMVYRTDEFRKRVDFLLQNTNQYIYVSSTRVFSANSGSPITESTDRLLDVTDNYSYLCTDEYALAKARQEDILRQHWKRNWVIVRPSITYSDSRLQFGCLELDWFLPRTFAGVPVVIPKSMLCRRTTLTWAGDTAKMISRLILKSQYFGQDFNVTCGYSRTWAELSEIYREVLGMIVAPVSVGEYLSLGLNVYQVELDRMIDRVFDNAKIVRATSIDATLLTTPEAGIRRSLEGARKSYVNLSRMQGRMDYLVAHSRIKEARSMREMIGYLVGFNPVLNAIAVMGKRRKYAPRMET